VDVAPHWGEPHISCVSDVICAMLCLSFICLVLFLLCMMEGSDFS
jgi:hypothetical protein